MKKRNLFIYMNVLAFIIFGALSAHSQNWQLVWSDEFDYTGPVESTKWQAENTCDDGGNAELQCYTSRDKNVWVDNGVLTITALQESYGGKGYTSGSVITKNRASWKYGRFEFRVKLPYSYAMWPAIWMMGINQDQVGWPRCGEIDVLEVFCDGGDWDHRIISTLHWWEETPSPGHYAAHGNNLNGLTPYNNSTPQDWHVYAMEWDESAIEMFVDGQSVFSMNITGTNKSEFHKEFFILMNIAVGGNKFAWNYPNQTSPNGSTVFPMTMEIDYVRIYQEGTSDIKQSLNRDNVKLYPVPANDYLIVETDYQLSKITISDYVGKVITMSENTENSIDISGLNSGVYFITLEIENGGTITKKFVKE